jgi:hypothetical protein
MIRYDAQTKSQRNPQREKDRTSAVTGIVLTLRGKSYKRHIFAGINVVEKREEDKHFRFEHHLGPKF